MFYEFLCFTIISKKKNIICYKIAFWAFLLKIVLCKAYITNIIVVAYNIFELHIDC